jgi:hypothetical protein
MTGASRIDRALRGGGAKLTGRPGQLYVPPRLGGARPPARKPLAPRDTNAAGLAATAAWYRQAGWL